MLPVHAHLSLLRRAAFLILGLSLATIGLPLAGFVGTANAASSAKPLKIVQLGDSYSAGNGAGSYVGPRKCFRSSNSYAQQWVKHLRSTGQSVSFISRACSGAVTADVTHDRYMDTATRSVDVYGTVDKDSPDARAKVVSGYSDCRTSYAGDEVIDVRAVKATPPGVDASGFPTLPAGYTKVQFNCIRSMAAQLNAVDKSTDLVVLTIGGNDLSFAQIIEKCFVSLRMNRAQCQQLVEAALRNVGGVGDKIAATLNAVRAKMRSDAKVVLIGYPLLEKDAGLKIGDSEGVYGVGQAVRELGRQGDLAQQRAVDTANSTAGPQVEFLPVTGLFAGHEPQAKGGNPSRWLLQAFDSTTTDEWYHPNKIGHQKLAELLESKGAFGVARPDVGAGPGVDIAFVIDTTGSMGTSINSAKAAATQIARDVAASSTSARFALVDYRDYPERTGDAQDYPAKLRVDFTSSVDQISAGINALSLGYGGDGPETMYSGLHTAFGLSWRPGVKKMAIVLADAPPLSPEPISGLTAAQIAAEARAIDPVEVHSVDVGSSTSDDLDSIISQTNGGRYASSPSEAAAAIQQAIESSASRPFAWAGGPYVVKVGDTVTLDGSGSFAVDGDLVSYEWDLDDDGVTDVTTTDPVLTRAMPVEYDGLVGLKVTDSQGLVGLATAVLKVTDDGDEVPREEDNCPDVANNNQTDADGDGVGDLCDSSPGPVGDADPEVFLLGGDEDLGGGGHLGLPIGAPGGQSTGQPTGQPAQVSVKPGKPRAVKLKRGKAGKPFTVTVRWKVPRAVAGAKVSGYQVRVFRVGKHGKVTSKLVSRKLAPKSRSLVVRVRKGTYVASVRALTKSAHSPWSAWTAKTRSR